MEPLDQRVSTISIAAKPRTAVVRNIIVPVGICARNSIIVRAIHRAGSTAAWPCVRASGKIIRLIDDGSACYFLDVECYFLAVESPSAHSYRGESGTPVSEILVPY